MKATANSVLLRLPPFSYSWPSCLKWLARKGIVKVHALMLVVLYSALFISAHFEGAVWIGGGVGLLQNPPFYIHLLCGALSVPLLLLLATRVLGIPEAEDENAVSTFLSLIRKSKAKNAIWNIAFLAGLFSLAYALSLATYYRRHHFNIYDSLLYPLTFATYFMIRVYLYLLCYPLVFAAAPAITFNLFKGLDKSGVGFRPFHYDEMGGLRRYFVAVDRPIYALQSFVVLIALANYISWGGFEPVPILLAVAAPIIVTLLALFLFAHFRRVLNSKRQKEIQVVCQQQMEFYSSVRNMTSLGSKDCIELLEKIEATERIIEIMKKSPRGGFGKYLINIGVLLAPHVLKPVGVMLANKLFGGTP